MKKTLKFIFSRFTLVALAIVLQLILWIVLPAYLNYKHPIIINNFLVPFNLIIAVLALLSILWIINSDIKIEGQLPLIILCILAPAVGIVFCAIFVKIKLPRKTKKYLKETLEQTKNATAIQNETEKAKQLEIEKELGRYLGQFNYIYNTTNLRSYKNTNVDFYNDGKAFFDSLILELEKAKSFIFMEYFIIEKGQMWNKIHTILKQKAKEGLDVRLMYDDLGTISRLPSNFYKKLNTEGIKCVKFNEYSQFTSSIYNNRDHRKITVIDGRVGFMGGINIADEYANINCSYGKWKDSAIKLTGEGVNGLTCILLQLYGIQSGKIENYTNYFVSHSEKSDGIVCPFGDGPKYFYGEHIGENVYINLISQAQKTIYITTPYLIIDNQLKDALISASKRGVDVRIITPHIPDKKAIFKVTRSNYKALQDGGVKIYEFKDGFIHAKQVLVDGELAIVGTINLDYRSMIHHYECGVLMYKTNCIKDIKADFGNLFDVSIDMKDFKQSWFAKIFCALIKLFTPLF